MLSPLLEDPAPEWPLWPWWSAADTTLYQCEALGQYEILGSTVDDAAGEASIKWPYAGPGLPRRSHRGQAVETGESYCDRVS